MRRTRTPFIGIDTFERRLGLRFEARLGSNESGIEMSPRVLEAIRREAPEAGHYPDPTNFELREALAAHHRVPAGNIVVAEGIDALLGYLHRAYVAPGQVVLASRGGYPVFRYHAEISRARVEEVPYAQDLQDLAGLALRATAAHPRLVYLANPDNPTGSMWGARDLESFLGALPAGSLLCLDEAYLDFAPQGLALEIEPTDPRVLRLRTFSKAYGLAGMRIGYAIGHAQHIEALDSVRNHFAVNRLAQVAALAALADREHLCRVLALTDRARSKIATIASKHGLTPLESHTNFVALDCGRDAAYADAMLQGLLERRVFIRKPGEPPLDRLIRVSVGSDEALALFDAALGQTLQALSGHPV